MKENIGFLGLGAGGSNICEVAESLGYRTAIMNTSPEDLESIKSIKNKLLIGNNGGAGKNRTTAKQEVKKYYKDIIEFVKTKFSDEKINLVYLTFSTSGGTGSGMAPMILDVLSKFIPDKKFGAIAILPTADESAVSQYNCLENLNELSKLDVPTLLVDNNNFIVKGNRLSKKQLFDAVNKAVMNEFENLFKEREASKYGNMDSRDLMTLLLTPGVTLISTFKVNGEGYDQNSFNKRLMLSWDRSIFANIEYDHVVKRMGFIYDMSDTVTKCINYDLIRKEVGKEIELFEGFHTPQDGDASVVSVLTGLSFPEKRIREIKEIVSKSKEQINTERKQVNILDGDDSDWFNGSRNDLFGSPSSAPKSNSGELDLEALFSQY